MESKRKRCAGFVANSLAGVCQDRKLLGHAETSTQSEECATRQATAKLVARDTGTMTASEMLEGRGDA